MTLPYAMFSKPGRAKANEDSILPVTKVGSSTWIGIADGMGGHEGGAAASQCAISAVTDYVAKYPEVSMAELFQQVSQRLVELANRRPDLADMGTTLSVCSIRDGKASIGHVGDTRIYHIRGRGLETRSKDQTEVQHLVDTGVLSAREAKRYPRRNVLLSALMPGKSYDLYQTEFDVIPGDRLVLISDGAYSKVSKREIADIANHQMDVTNISSHICSTIESRGPTDDFSALVFEIQPEN